jgi:hypothetical protein
MQQTPTLKSEIIFRQSFEKRLVVRLSGKRLAQIPGKCLGDSVKNAFLFIYTKIKLKNIFKNLGEAAEASAATADADEEVAVEAEATAADRSGASPAPTMSVVRLFVPPSLRGTKQSSFLAFHCFAVPSLRGTKQPCFSCSIGI